MRHPRHITLKKKWPQRYFSGLSHSMKLRREIELLRRRRYNKFQLSKSNSAIKTKKSRWTNLFHKVYPNLPFKKEIIAKRTGIPKSVLNTVYNRGRRAWQTGGSRPGVTANQWGVARVYKFVLITKGKAPRNWYANRFDPNKNLRRGQYRY